MLQLVALLALSWLLIWFFEKKNLSVLGLTPSPRRLKYFILLFLVSAALAASAFLLRMYFVREVYTVNPSMTFYSVVQETWYQFRTVLTEELLCRGAVLYILIKKAGRIKAVFISSVLFAVLHWFNAGVWGNPAQMLMVFAFTFTMGLLLAYAYAQTFSLLIPFAIHFGWNLTQNYIFPETAAGKHLLILAYPPPEVTLSYLSFFTMLLLPKVAVIIINFFIVKSHPRVEAP